MNNVSAAGQTARPPVLLIQTGTAPDPIKETHGDLSVWFRDALGLEHTAIQVVEVYLGDELPPPDPRRVAVITGSWDMVTDKLPWSEKTAEWIRQAMAIGMPLFGVCYGHQLMAYALGGEVDYHPRGREMGCMTVTLTDAGREDPLTAWLDPYFSAHLTHLQTVTVLPPGAQRLASSAHDKNQVIRYAPHAVSTQFHPEFTPAILSTMITVRHAALLREGENPEAMRSALADAANARQLLKNFIFQHVPDAPIA